MKFLVVDDSVTMRRIIINSLQRFGYEDCTEATDGSEALERFDASVDFVITDWNMPALGGLDLVQRLRERVDGRDVPILMVTSRSGREDIAAAASAGVNSYVVKPFTPEVLREKIKEVLEGARRARPS